MRECLNKWSCYIRLQVDDGEDECYEDCPYDTDDSNGNYTIINFLLTNQ